MNSISLKEGEQDAFRQRARLIRRYGYRDGGDGV